MKPGAQKRKGNRYENIVATALSLWISSGERDDLFEREKTSGARSTTHAKKDRIRKNTAGDIVAAGPEAWKFTEVILVECKHEKDFNFNGLFYQTAPKSGILGHWNILLDKAKLYDRQPMLIFRQNARSDMMAINTVLAKHFLLNECDFLSTFRLPNQFMHVIPMSNFFAKADPELLNRKIPQNPLRLR